MRIVKKYYDQTKAIVVFIVRMEQLLVRLFKIIKVVAKSIIILQHSCTEILLSLHRESFGNHTIDIFLGAQCSTL